jgi:hypothetical protein
MGFKFTADSFDSAQNGRLMRRTQELSARKPRQATKFGGDCKTVSA